VVFVINEIDVQFFWIRMAPFLAKCLFINIKWR